MNAKRAEKQHCIDVQGRVPHTEEIKAAIRIRAGTMANLARSWGYKSVAIRMCLFKPYPKLEKKIAEYLGVKPEQLWPSRYDSKGNSLHQGRWHKP
jgi:Ner family transcriptional regulator